jgi:hypothetical protein
VTLTATHGARHYAAAVPGALLDWAAPIGHDGRRELFLLAAPEDDESDRRTLYRLEWTEPRLTLLLTRLSPQFDRLLALDLDGDGQEELLLGRPGRIFEAAPLDGSATPELTRLFSAPGVDLAAVLPVRGAASESGHLSLPGVGLIRHFSPRAGTSGWGLAGRRPLATQASRHQYGLRLTTPRSTLLRLTEEDVYAVGPESVDRRRLRSALLPAAKDGGAPRQVWSRLPGPERVQWSWFDVLDGRPVLIVSTNSADTLGIFERQQLRLFSLYGDRTRAGVGPWLTAATTSRRWQPLEPVVLDIDGDGDDDLVVVQVAGLGSGKIKLEAFLNSGRRSFAPKTRTSVLEQPPTGWNFGSDLTDDGLPDLVLLSQGNLSVYPLLGLDSKRLLAKSPRWSFVGSDIPRVEHSVEIGSGGVAVSDARPSKSGQPVVLDLDGDGRGEILLAENPQWGFGRLRVIFLPSRQDK